MIAAPKISTNGSNEPKNSIEQLHTNVPALDEVVLNWLRHNSFSHGLHPPEQKDDTRHLAIRQFPFAPLLIVPLSQHLGKPAVPIVRVGQ